MAATRIELPTQLEAYIQFKIDSGLYSNGVEVIRDALRHMMERDSDLGRVQQLRHALQHGLNQLDADQGVVWTPERWREIDQQAQQRIQAGRSPKADVCPSPPADHLARSARRSD